jgi:hypothetical protein
MPITELSHKTAISLCWQRASKYDGVLEHRILGEAACFGVEQLYHQFVISWLWPPQYDRSTPLKPPAHLTARSIAYP